MKLATKTREFHTNGVIKSTGYKVANSANAMEILSDLYSDRILATIRELSTNARDASKLTNDHRPFEVTLPSSNNRMFVIRDFGPGMSEDKLEEMYTVYFLSDKSHDNTMTGAFGLGSKSPFSYCDSFTTISYHKGKKITAINAKNERGRPTFNIMSIEATTEPDGLEVSFPVKFDDIGQFKKKAIEVYRFFDMQPKFIGSDTFKDIKFFQQDIKDRTLFADDNWRVLNTIYSRVVMGNISYPIESTHFNKQVARFINLGVMIHINTGDLDIPPSRDALKYTAYTKRVINREVQKIIDFTKSKIESEINNCKFMWDARLKLIELSRGNCSRVYSVVLPSISFNGKSIRDEVCIYSTNKDIDTKKFVSFSKNHNETISRGIDPTIIVSNKAKFVVSDLKNKGQAALRRFLTAQSSTQETYYLFDNKDKLTHKDGVKYLTEVVGVNPADILYTSTFPKNSGAGSAVKKNKDILQCQLLINPSWTSSNKSYWSTTTVEMSKDKYYYVLLDKSYDIACEGRRLTGRKANQIRSTLNIQEPIIGLTEKRFELIKDKTNWLSLSVPVKNYLDHWHSDLNNIKSLEVSSSLEEYHTYKELGPLLKNNTELFKFLDKFKSLPTRKNTEKIQNLLEIHNSYSRNDYVRPKKSTIKINTDFILQKYPLLSLIDTDRLTSSRYNTVKTSDLKLVADYINSIG